MKKIIGGPHKIIFTVRFLVLTLGFGLFESAALAQLSLKSPADGGGGTASTSVIQGVSAGAAHSLLLRDGKVFSWGADLNGELGDGARPYYNQPNQAPSTAASSGINTIKELDGLITKVSAGSAHTLALTRNGTAKIFGCNMTGNNGWCQYGGQFSISDVRDSSGNIISNIADIAAGGSHSLLLKKDGSVWSWGRNDAGQLGLGNTLNQNFPIKINGLPQIRALAAGSAHSLALDTSGNVWSWGYNGFGALGDGTTNQRLSPVRVVALSGATQIAAGAYHSMALKLGTVYSWGLNSVGQLGLGNKINAFIPTPILGQPGISSISTGAYHSVAITPYSTLLVWGLNFGGQLGLGDNTNRLSPVPGPSIRSLYQVSAGGQHTLALSKNGEVYAWGDNQNGQLGDSSFISKSRPERLAVPVVFRADHLNFNNGDQVDNGMQEISQIVTDVSGHRAFFAYSEKLSSSSAEWGIFLRQYSPDPAPYGTLGAPILISDSTINSRNPQLALLSNGCLIAAFENFHVNTVLDRHEGVFVTTSCDGGLSWSTQQKLGFPNDSFNTEDGDLANQITNIKLAPSGIVSAGDKSFLLTSYSGSGSAEGLFLWTINASGIVGLPNLIFRGALDNTWAFAENSSRSLIATQDSSGAEYGLSYVGTRIDDPGQTEDSVSYVDVAAGAIKSISSTQCMQGSETQLLSWSTAQDAMPIIFNDQSHNLKKVVSVVGSSAILSSIDSRTNQAANLTSLTLNEFAWDEKRAAAINSNGDLYLSNLPTSPNDDSSSIYVYRCASGAQDCTRIYRANLPSPYTNTTNSGRGESAILGNSMLQIVADVATDSNLSNFNRIHLVRLDVVQ